jgi:putative methionine-R-sulfoxide reductase with GAF domain
MAAIAHSSQPPSSNRRARVRHKVHVPAYATFTGVLSGDSHDLCEVLNISEIGLALQSTSPMHVDQTVDLCLTLAEAGGEIPALARVAWLSPSGRVGFHLSIPDDFAMRRLQEWLLLNAIAAAANAEASMSPAKESENSALPQNHLQHDYSDLLNAVSAVQREAESMGPDLEAILSLVASRARSLLRSSGAAIALAGKEPDTMICRASAGESAPPVGVTLHLGSGFSGECVRSGKLMSCDDTEVDDRVDQESCRALEIRSILAAPVRSSDKTIGLVEVFSAQPGNYSDNDSAVLQRVADTISAAVNRAMRAHTPPPQPPTPPKPYTAPPGSVLFAHLPEEAEKKSAPSNDDEPGGIRLPRAHLILLMAAAGTIFMALGFLSAPWIQPWIQAKLQARAQAAAEQTVLASSRPPVESSSAPKLSADSANLPQLRELAAHGDAAAENALGLLYSTGDAKQGIVRDESEAARWFTKAAENGSVPAQSKLGSLYWGGRGVTKDDNRAYFWTVLARASGEDASKVLAPFIAARLTPPQRAAIEQQAEQWLQQHETRAHTQASR